jgi:aflatoxin B1 aldehyde reductase
VSNIGHLLTPILGASYRGRYWHAEYFDALDLLRPVAKKHSLTEAECALRWMNHHSQLKRDMKGPLPEEVLKAFDEGWDKVRGVAGVGRYWH